MARRAELRYDIVYNVTGEDKLGRVETLTESILQNNRLIEAQAKRRGQQTAQESQAVDRNNQVLEKRIRTLQRIRENLDANDPKYIRATALERKLTEELTRSTGVQQKYNATKVKATRSFELLNGKIQDVSLAYREVQSRVRANTMTTEEASAETARLDSVMGSLADEVEVLGRKAGVSEGQLRKLKAGLISARNSGVSATRAVKGIGDAFTGTTKVSSSANQLLLSFGDIAQDSAQFSFGFAQGARAIGNNIAFASEQILILTQKMEANKKGSATLSGVFKELGTQLAGPVGIIVGINVAITAITMLAQRQERLKKKTEDATQAFKEQAQAVLSATQSLDLGDEFSFFDVTGAAKALDASVGLQIGINSLGKEISRLKSEYNALNNQSINYAGFSSVNSAETNRLANQIENATKSQEDFISQQDRVLKNYPILNDLSQETRDELKKLSSEYKVNQELQEAARKQIRLTAQGGKEYLDTLDETRRITSELELAEAERALGIETNRITQEGARKALEDLTSSLDSGKMAPELYANAVKVLSDAMSALKDETKDANDELKRQQRDLMAGLEIELLLAQRSGDPASVRTARLAVLEQRIKDEELTANEIKLSRLEIDYQYFDAVEQLERESVERRKKIQDGLAKSTEQINNQVVRSIQGTFQALVGGNKVAALAMLAVEKGLAIGKIRSDSIAAINQLEVEGASAAAKGAVALLSGNFVEAGKQFGAVKEMVATIGAIKSASKKNIAKVVGIGLLQGAATISSGSQSRGGRGSSGGSSASSVQEQPAFGSKFTEVERRPQFLPTGSQSSQAAQVSVQILADRKQLYALVRQGEEEYKQIISA